MFGFKKDNWTKNRIEILEHKLESLQFKLEVLEEGQKHLAKMHIDLKKTVDPVYKKKLEELKGFMTEPDPSSDVAFTYGYNPLSK